MKKNYKKRNKRKLSLKKIIVFILFIILILYIYTNNHSVLFNSNDVVTNLSNSLHTNQNTIYPVIKQDQNEKYAGIGQEKVSNKDGYFTTFTTDNHYQKIYKEYKQNGDSSWSNKEYWGSTMAENGCGITVMSIILSGYGKDYTPEDLREKYYPVMNYENFSKELSSTFGIKNSDFYYDSIHLSNEKIIEHLKSNRPIVVCVWNKPTDNRWTTASHYMALLATDGDHMIYVSNPNGLENDSKSSGWYDIDEITPYLAKALYIEDYK